MSTVLYSQSFDVRQNDFVAAGEVSAQIKQRLKKMGMEPVLIRKIAIAFYEAEINMIIHSYGGTMSVEVFPELIVIVCADTGPGIPDISLAMQEGYSTASEDVRNMGFGAGMGLPNISKNSSEMDVQSSPSGTTITMKFSI